VYPAAKVKEKSKAGNQAIRKAFEIVLQDPFKKRNDSTELESK
jgi:hypothetical protein